MRYDNTTNGQGSTGPFQLHYDSFGRLVFTGEDGEQHVGVEPVRAFPLSDPRHGLALCNADGHELLWIANLDELPASLRRLLEEDLARREFVPIIRRILKAASPMLPAEWEVETDRGPTQFVVEDEDNIHRLDDRRALVTDSHGIRYLIPDMRALDTTSRHILERYL